jgi:adenine deaminase
VNVCTAEIQQDIDIAIWGGRIAYVGNADHCIGTDTQVIDANGQYAAPGFLDGHIHVESSMLGVGEYARAVIPHGTVGIYLDPHEICNVVGLDGVELMVADAKRTPLKAMITTPSCVPAVPGFEDTGASIDAEDIARSMQGHSVVGLGEMMDFPGVLGADGPTHDKLRRTLEADRIVTGHYPARDLDRGLNAYCAAGIRCCHESTTPESALAKMRLGMYAMLREGSAWRDLAALAPIIASGTIDTRFACLVSDDTHPHTLLEHGHLDHLLRRAVEEGIDVITAIQMITLNTATCFRMDNELGSLTPGKCADIVLLDDLDSLVVCRVFIDGELVAKNGRCLFALEPFVYPPWATNTMHVGTEVCPETFAIAAPDPQAESVTARVIEVIPERVGTIERSASLAVVDGFVQIRHKVGEKSTDTDGATTSVWGSGEKDTATRVGEKSTDADILKAFVFERHHATGSFGVGFVKGFGIASGALASTVAHDAHNLLVMGTDDADMALAANALIRSSGGMVVVKDGEVIGQVELPVAGIMGTGSVDEIARPVAGLKNAWRAIGCTMESPFMTMALIPLACLPELRLTNRGLIDCVKFEQVALWIS